MLLNIIKSTIFSILLLLAAGIGTTTMFVVEAQTPTATPPDIHSPHVSNADQVRCSTGQNKSYNVKTEAKKNTIVSSATVVKQTGTSLVLGAQTVSQPTEGSLNADLLFAMVNDFRAQNGLPPFIKDDNVCSLASQRAPELYNEVFGAPAIHAGLKARNLPYWITENAKYGSSEQSAFNWWLNSPLHRSAITGDAQFSCTACHGNSCVQLFTSYIPK